MFVIAVGVFGLNPEEVAAGFFDGEKLEGQRLAGFGLKLRPLVDVLARRLLNNQRRAGFIFFFARFGINSNGAQSDSGMLRPSRCGQGDYPNETSNPRIAHNSSDSHRATTSNVAKCSWSFDPTAAPFVWRGSR